MRAATRPCVRGPYMTTFAAHVDALAPRERDLVRGGVRKSTWEAIERSGFLEWLPLEFNVECTNAVVSRLGLRKAHEFFRSLMTTTAKTPLLQSLIECVIRRYGRDPAVALSWVPKGFELMFKASGHWMITHRGSSFVSLKVRALPHLVMQDRVWLESVASSLSGLFPLVDLDGQAVVRDIDPASGAAAFQVSWRQRGTFAECSVKRRRYGDVPILIEANPGPMDRKLATTNGGAPKLRRIFSRHGPC